MSRVHASRLARALFVAIALTSSRAHAQSDDERAAARLFRAGTAAYEAHDFTAAALAFEEAYRRVPRGAAAYNAGLAWEGAKEDARAADAFDLALSDPSLSASAAEDARSRLSRVERVLGRVDVSGAASISVTVAHVADAKLPRRVHLPPGEHVVSIKHASGRTERQMIIVRAGEVSPIALTADATPPVTPVVVPPPPARGGSRTRTIGFVGIGVGVAATATAIVLGLGAWRARDAYDDSGRTDVDARSDAVAYRTWTNVAWATAAVAGIGGLVLVLTAPRSSAPVANGFSLSF